ncbi:MAG: glycogen-binding domain-containing protein [Phycisphaerae bacterium]|nr:glycogen-binding domain-containing protein [Phycisphaerae bacterium]
MTNKGKLEHEGLRSTARITCFAPNAHEIALVGSFNDWDPGALRMTQDTDGQWSADLQLPAGRYEYKFVVDGVSCCDPHLKNGHPDCEQCAPHACGELNRILLIR